MPRAGAYLFILRSLLRSHQCNTKRHGAGWSHGECADRWSKYESSLGEADKHRTFTRTIFSSARTSSRRLNLKIFSVTSKHAYPLVLSVDLYPRRRLNIKNIIIPRQSVFRKMTIWIRRGLECARFTRDNMLWSDLDTTPVYLRVKPIFVRLYCSQ